MMHGQKHIKFVSVVYIKIQIWQSTTAVFREDVCKFVIL